jgi:SpoVK/Ycf46/Vps4 family AAA+-type ATPase
VTHRLARNLPRGCGILPRKRISLDGGVGVRLTNITDSAVDQARQKLADAEEKSDRASAALIEALLKTKAMIDETKKRMPNIDAADLLAKLLTEEEVKKVRQDTADYAKRLVGNFHAARDEMQARFVKAIAADENAD